MTTRYSAVQSASESVGGDDAGGKVGLDHTWAYKDTSLDPKNVGKPLRKDFSPTVTRPVWVGRDHSSV